MNRLPSGTAKTQHRDDPCLDQISQAEEHLSAESPKKAIAICQEILSEQPDHVRATLLLGVGLHNARQYEQAISYLRKGLQKGDGQNQARIALARCLHETGMSDEAIKLLKLVTKIRQSQASRQTRADLAYANATLDNVYRDTRGAGASSERKRCLQAVIRFGDRRAVAKAHCDVGQLFGGDDRKDEAIKHFRKSLDVQPDAPHAYWQMSRFLDLSKEPDIVALIRSHYESEETSDVDRSIYAFTLAAIEEKSGNHQKAFEYLNHANAQKRKDAKFSLLQYTVAMKKIKTVFDKNTFKQPRGAVKADPIPIFIVGMPRSGTSLIEQILASHSEVYGAGELIFLRRAIDHAFDNYPVQTMKATSETWEQAGLEYLSRIKRLSKGSKYVVDKNPFNFESVGAIRMIFDNAIVIHADRDLMGVGFSCFKLFFGSRFMDFAYNQKNLGSVMRHHRNLMAHWHKVLPDFLYRCEYSTLVSDTESEIRRLLDHCGLEFEQNCLDFHQTKRFVPTPSATQVRQPAYQSSVDKWKRYEKQLKPMRRALRGGPLSWII